ncbi:MAG: hypothetical protein ACP5M4_06950 [Acidobacteriaceae bacterium]
MEADWSADIAPGLPEIIVPWSSNESDKTLTWRDLRLAGPHLDAAIQSIPSAAAEPALAEALRTLHAPNSPWFTSKCDLWTTNPADSDPPDPYEFEAADLVTDTTTYAAPLHLCASYIDILPANTGLFQSFPAQENLLNALTTTLRTQPQPHARIDLVVRAARTHGVPGFAFTAYAAGCGLTADDAHRSWQQALARLTHALQAAALPG